MLVRRPSLEALFREVDNFSPKKEKLQPPRIRISSNRKDGLSCIAESYHRPGSPYSDRFQSGWVTDERRRRSQPALYRGRADTAVTGCGYLPR